MQRNYAEMTAIELKDEADKLKQTLAQHKASLINLHSNIQTACYNISQIDGKADNHKKSNKSLPLRKSAKERVEALKEKIENTNSLIRNIKHQETQAINELQLLVSASIDKLGQQQANTPIASPRIIIVENSPIDEHHQLLEALTNYKASNKEPIHAPLIQAADELLGRYIDDNTSPHAKKILICAKNILENNSQENREMLDIILKAEFDAKNTSNVLIAGLVFSGAALLVAATALAILSVTIIPLLPLFFVASAIGIVGAGKLVAGLGLYYNRQDNLAKYESSHSNIKRFALQANSLFQQSAAPSGEQPERETDSLLTASR